MIAANIRKQPLPRVLIGAAILRRSALYDLGAGQPRQTPPLELC